MSININVFMGLELMKAKHIKILRNKIHKKRHYACQFCIQPVECEIRAGLYCKICGSRVEYHEGVFKCKNNLCSFTHKGLPEMIALPHETLCCRRNPDVCFKNIGIDIVKYN
jgi:hypothetical protein